MQQRNRRADVHLTILDDPPVDTPQVAAARATVLNEAQCGGTETRVELRTTVVGLTGDFGYGRSHLQPGPGRQVTVGQVQGDKKVIAKQSQRLAIGDQLGYAAIDDRDLAIRVSRWARAPCVPMEALGPAQVCR